MSGGAVERGALKLISLCPTDAVWEGAIRQARLPNGHKGEVDVFKYFVFLAGTLIGVGLLGTLGLQIVDEEELIDHGVENL